MTKLRLRPYRLFRYIGNLPSVAWEIFTFSTLSPPLKAGTACPFLIIALYAGAVNQVTGCAQYFQAACAKLPYITF